MIQLFSYLFVLICFLLVVMAIGLLCNSMLPLVSYIEVDGILKSNEKLGLLTKKRIGNRFPISALLQLCSTKVQQASTYYIF